MYVCRGATCELALHTSMPGAAVRGLLKGAGLREKSHGARGEECSAAQLDCAYCCYMEQPSTRYARLVLCQLLHTWFQP